MFFLFLFLQRLPGELKIMLDEGAGFPLKSWQLRLNNCGLNTPTRLPWVRDGETIAAIQSTSLFSWKGQVQ
jgi:hypothetical protein